MNPNTPEIPAEKYFDVRDIPCSVKHGQIFARWNSLPVDDYFVLVNDHDPVPLRYQFEAEFRDGYSWDYLERGPVVFQVKIGKKVATQASPEAATASKCGCSD